MKRKSSIGEKIFTLINGLIMLFAVVTALYPMWYVLVASFSDPTAVSIGKVTLWIKGFTLASYQKTFATPYIGSSYLNTIFYAVVGTTLSMILTIFGAYALSKKRLHGRSFLMFFISFTMWFGAGMIPSYITYRMLGLLDTRMGVLLSGILNTFYVIMMRTAFESVPDSLEESMKLDGATDFQVLFNCYIPLCVPTIMTLVLYYFVGRWNTYLWPMIILKDETKVPLQVVLKKLIVEMSGLFDQSADVDVSSMSKETIVYSTMIIAVVPMLVMYPFIQKFFVKGVVVGAVKG